MTMAKSRTKFPNAAASSLGGGYSLYTAISDEFPPGKKYQQLKDMEYGCEIVAATPGRLIDFMVTQLADALGWFLLCLLKVDTLTNIIQHYPITNIIQH